MNAIISSHVLGVVFKVIATFEVISYHEKCLDCNLLSGDVWCTSYISVSPR